MQIAVKQRPILFNTVMVGARKEGRKRMTRRVMNPQPVRDEMIDGERYLKPAGWPLLPVSEFIERFCPYGKVGDILWIREEHYRFGHWERVPDTNTATGKQKWRFVADSEEVRYYDNPPEQFFISRHLKAPNVPTWYKRLARFMPKNLCRTYLRITDIRIERLQDISEEDAIAEGIEGMQVNENGKLRMVWRDYMKNTGTLYDPVRSFRTLWESINGPGSCERNDWVWVVVFNAVTLDNQ